MDFSTTFTDALGREWTVELNGLPDKRRLEKIAGVKIEDLAPIIDPKKKGDAVKVIPLSEFIGEPTKVFDVFYALVEPVAKQRNLSKEDVEDGIDEDAQMQMLQAVIGAICLFFRLSPQRQAPLRAMMKGLPALEAKMNDEITKKLAKLDIGKILAEVPGLDDDSDPSTESNGSSPSTPDGSSPSATESPAK